jgi:hypothetical protein
MITISNEIFGWFDFSDIYDQAVIQSKDGDSMLEIGCYMGKSTAYLLEKIKSSGKEIDLHVVDLFDTSNIFQSELYNGIINNSHSFEDIFDKNMSDLGFCPKKHKGLSSDMFSKFDDNYFSMIFIDGSHDYKSVVDDMKLYYPKLKSGGIFAGHDYTQRDIGVIKAVNEFSEKYSIPFEVKNTSWYMIKK